MAVKALCLGRDDAVATLVNDAEPGESISVETLSGDAIDTIVARDSIPAGHKVALRAVGSGDPVYKFGIAIGSATTEIVPGELVHIHNVASFVNAAGSAAGREEPMARLSKAELETFVHSCSLAAGVSESAARDLTDMIVEAELRGVTTHGVRRLPGYLGRVAGGSVSGTAVPETSVDGPLVKIAGNNAVGAHIARVASDMVVRAAKRFGVGIGLVSGGNHFGFAGYYATLMASAGMVAMVSSNGTPLVAVPGSGIPFFSNNPVAFAAPVQSGFVEADLATSMGSREKVRRAGERGEPVPDGWGVDEKGRNSSVAAEILGGALSPIGGEHGFALIFGLELLAGVLSGSNVATDVPPKDSESGPEENIGFFMLAVSIDDVVDRAEFDRRMLHLLNLGQDCAGAGFRYPGYRRWLNRTTRMNEGITLDRAAVDALGAVSRRFGVPLPAGFATGRTNG